MRRIYLISGAEISYSYFKSPWNPSIIDKNFKGLKIKKTELTVLPNPIEFDKGIKAVALRFPNEGRLGVIDASDFVLGHYIFKRKKMEALKTSWAKIDLPTDPKLIIPGIYVGTFFPNMEKIREEYRKISPWKEDPYFPLPITKIVYRPVYISREGYKGVIEPYSRFYGSVIKNIMDKLEKSITK